jgi:hypothetical protein
MDIKEQIKELISQDVALFDCQGDCPDEVAIYEKKHYGKTIRTDNYCNECFTSKIVKIFEQANPIQAGEDGLVKERYIEDKDIECFCGNSIKLLELYRLAKEAGLIQVQKALDESQAKQKQAEAVKKVFDWFLSRSYPEDDVIEITFSKTELDTFKQTLEEL